MITYEEVFTIAFVDGTYVDTYDYTTRTISWDIRGGLVMSNGKSVMSPAMALAHEMGVVNTIYCTS